MFIVFGQRFNKVEPFILAKDIKDVGKKGDVIYDGQPEKIKLGSWEDESVAKNMADNIKNRVPKRSWKIWVEETK